MIANGARCQNGRLNDVFFGQNRVLGDNSIDWETKRYRFCPKTCMKNSFSARIGVASKIILINYF